MIYEKVEGERDTDSDLYHKQHKAWNALAELELFLREKEAAKIAKSGKDQDEQKLANERARRKAESLQGSIYEQNLRGAAL